VPDVFLNLLVLRAADLDRSRRFYETLGLTLVKEKHGAGPEHYACEMGDTVFEIYPTNSGAESSASTRLGFRVPTVDRALESLREIGAEVIMEPKDSPWGRRAVVRDPDGYSIEITELKPSPSKGLT
jgi:catechol 2,3-dioxygenase-like lactoylglutathione lyase family enzyme